MSIDVMKQALEYLDSPSAKLWPAGTQHKIITALRTAIEQAEKQGPVACLRVRDGRLWGVSRRESMGHLPDGDHYLYATPPAAQRQPLTDEAFYAMAEVAWRAGWAACRDAEFVGEEAEDETWAEQGVNVMQDIKTKHGIGGEA